MAVTTTWKIDNMAHNTADGGVVAVHWSCTAKAATGESAIEAGKLRLEPDPSSGDFIDYNSLTEETVLGWVYNSLIEGEETAEEAKARIEKNRTGKVQSQINRKTAETSGMPWSVSQA